MSEGGRNPAGMTVNERLAVHGLRDAWEEAVRGRDQEAMIVLLRRAFVPDAKRVAAVVLADPAAYGF